MNIPSVKTDRSGIINFMEFVCSLWNILTLDETNMGCLAFMIADPTASKTLSCKCVHLGCTFFDFFIATFTNFSNL